ncbi:MAG: hypothetical protein H3C45_04120 [Bacteroidia bacterium]|nr:hypothetical protein [Bacteroidia bacterium]MCC7533059.1 hypothetical protein [Bacteroidia bacterium]
MDFPRYHKEIVGDLLDGKFILATDAKFIELKNSADFYGKFFKETFGFYLDIKSDYAYLISEDTMETLSRDICIFIGLLCYELDKEGKNFIDEIQYAEFDLETIDNYLDNSSYSDLILNNNQLKNSESRKQFLGTLNRRNIIDRNSDKKFSFTPAYKVFMDFAKNFAKGRLTKEQMIEND